MSNDVGMSALLPVAPGCLARQGAECGGFSQELMVAYYVAYAAACGRGLGTLCGEGLDDCVRRVLRGGLDDVGGWSSSGVEQVGRDTESVGDVGVSSRSTGFVGSSGSGGSYGVKVVDAVVEESGNVGLNESCEVKVVSVDEEVSSCVGGSLRGKNYLRNKASRDRKKARRGGLPRVDGGSCETVVSQSSCPSYGQALSDAEKEARETLARRRAAENKLKEKLALMKIASLEDEKKCQEYADLKRHRIIQWTNEAVAKSQQSLEKCKTIDPASSSSQADIRAQAKELADVKAHFDQFARRVAEYVPNCGELLESCKAPGTATMDFLIAQAACSSNAGSIDPLDVTDDMDVKVQGYVRARGYKAERFPVLTDEVIF